MTMPTMTVAEIFGPDFYTGRARAERSYTVRQLEGRGLTIVRGRYQSRTDLPPLPVAETAQDVADRMRCELHASMRGGRS